MHPSRASLRRAPSWLAALGLCFSCQADLPGGPPPLRSWLRVQGAALQREGDGHANVQDSAGFGLVSGYDFISTPVQLGLELDVNFSSHDISGAGFGNRDARLDVWRIGFGSRLAADLIPYRLGAHVRGGGYFAEEEDINIDGIALDGSGFYYGGGLDFWFDGSGSLGPFITVWEREDDGLREVQIGVGASFHF